MGVKEWFPNFYMQLLSRPSQATPRIISFRVSPKMTKFEIKEYLWKIYNVPVKKVMTQNFLGKRKRIYGPKRVLNYKHPDFKKAIVILDLEKLKNTNQS